MVASFIAFICLLLALPSQAQLLQPAHWHFAYEPAKAKIGQEIDLVLRAEIDKGWHVYGFDFSPDLGPNLLELKIEKHPSFAIVGKPKQIGTKKVYDEVFEGDLRLFEGEVEVRQTIKVLRASIVAKGTVEAQACTDAGKCVSVNADFDFGPLDIVAKGSAAAKNKDALVAATDPVEPSDPSTPVASPGQPPSLPMVPDTSTRMDTAMDTAAKYQTNMPTVGADSNLAMESASAGPPLVPASAADMDGLWGFFFIAFGSGLVGLLTPCVFPMIPMTVSFFTRQGGTRGRAIGQALLYGFFIIALYVFIGVLLARLNGPEFANFLATHWLPNLLFFGIFMVFAFSFLGYFEIVLPSSWATAADTKADKGGVLGIFFMALTLVLVSFSCTGPIAGAILVQSAGGAVIKPIVGMLGFSLAFALPFGLFAAFPQWLQSLPKSGGWLNSVKVVLGFLELALAFKFLSVADQAYHWHLLDREIYLAIWIVVFTLLGLYLLGKLRLPHDSPVAEGGHRVGWLPLSLAVAVFSFVVYLVPGMWGAPLKALAGYLPPLATHDFNLGAQQGSGPLAPANPACGTAKYSDFLHLPHGLNGYFDYAQGLACARQTGKPMFIDFTGHGCVNCREMEARVWADPKILTLLRDRFVVTALYVDDKTELPASQHYTSTYDGKLKTSIGKQNADFQITRYNNNAQPFYMIVDGNGKTLAGPVSYNLDVDAFGAFLQQGLAASVASNKGI